MRTQYPAFGLSAMSKRSRAGRPCSIRVMNCIELSIFWTIRTNTQTEIMIDARRNRQKLHIKTYVGCTETESIDYYANDTSRFELVRVPETIEGARQSIHQS